MAFQLKWSIQGETQLSRVLLNLDAGTRDLLPAFKDSADFLVKQFGNQVFSTQGAAIQERWARLSPYTVAQKARHGYPPDILIRTGAMKRSFVSEVTSRSATIGNTAEYFKYHQSNQPRQHLPRRVMMKIAEPQKVEIVRIFQAYLRKKIKQ